MLRVLLRLAFIGLGCMTVVVMLCALISDTFYQMTLHSTQNLIFDQQSLKDIDWAIRFNPNRSEYHYQKYYILKEQWTRGQIALEKRDFMKEQQQKALSKAIELEPTKDTYHAYRAILLQKMHPRPSKEVQRTIRDELTKAYELKPLSPVYKKYLAQ